MLSSMLAIGEQNSKETTKTYQKIVSMLMETSKQVKQV